MPATERQVAVLRALEDLPGSSPHSVEVASRAGLKPGGVPATLDSLERTGHMYSTTPRGQSGRRWTITDRGRQLLAEAS